MQSTGFIPKFIGPLFIAFVSILLSRTLYAATIADVRIPLCCTITHNQLEAGIGAAGPLVAAIGAFVALLVYLQKKNRDQQLAAEQVEATKRSDRLDKFEAFQGLQKRYRDDDAIKKVVNYLDKPTTARPSDSDMHVFMGFYEEIALMVASGLMSPDVAYYTIGFDAGRFYNDVPEPNFRNDPSWTLFNDFAKKAIARRMTKEEILKLKF